ncbi:polyprenyl synthetase family protein, partial [Pseudoxanthomonas sp. SGD-10]
MYSISDLQELLDSAIREYKYPQQPQELYEPVSYLLALGGKRLRPALLLMATDLFAGDVKSAINAALAIEFFHNFTLMHDDIMDKAPLRRGNPTVHTKWNDAVAILSGDIMLIESYKLLMGINPAVLPQVLNVFNQTATGVCEGQQFDMNFEKQNQVQIEDYINMIRLKTAVLLGGALQIGALIANASTEDLANIYSFGENIGIAFQLQDDILDVYGNPENFG